MRTADLYDANEGRVQVVEGTFLALGRRRSFAGPIATLKVFEDNPLVRAEVEQPGDGRVLVIDGGGSLRCALVGDKLAGFAADHGWAGLVVYGCVRDRAVIDTLDIGVRCLGTTPRRSSKHGFGERGVPVRFAGVLFEPGAWLYADEDGILTAPLALAAPAER
ncbi:MAG: ribonuclease E activity regulator RraA [Sandaracinaceae bacterium]